MSARRDTLQLETTAIEEFIARHGIGLADGSLLWQLLTAQNVATIAVEIRPVPFNCPSFFLFSHDSAFLPQLLPFAASRISPNLTNEGNRCDYEYDNRQNK